MANCAEIGKSQLFRLSCCQMGALFNPKIISDIAENVKTIARITVLGLFERSEALYLNTVSFNA